MLPNKFKFVSIKYLSIGATCCQGMKMAARAALHNHTEAATPRHAAHMIGIRETTHTIENTRTTQND